MSEIRPKSAFLHRQIRHALLSGRYLPGQRIDPAGLAAEFGTSPTPVRFALYRLVGEGLLADHARSGLYVPMPTEVALRELYGWMELLLLVACDAGAPPDRRERRPGPDPDLVDEDVVAATWTLFDAIALTSGQRELYDAARRANDRLAPVRRAKRRLFDDAAEELRDLAHHWHRGDIRALRGALRQYHARRKQLVPCIVASLNERRDHSH